MAWFFAHGVGMGATEVEAPDSPPGGGIWLNQLSVGI